jgi:hypothetical protein
MSRPTEEANSWIWRNEKSPADPMSARALARARAADLEKSIPEQKEKLAGIRAAEVSDPAEYMRYVDTKKLEELEKKLKRSEVMLGTWQGEADKAERNIPVYEGLVKKSRAWIDGHEEAEGRAAGQFKSKIGSIQTELVELIKQFRAQGWTPPQELTEVHQATFFLRVMVNHLGAQTPPGMTYTWSLENPGKRNYDL